MKYCNDLTEGGHLESDFGAFSLAEWWYLNGRLELEAEDGEKRVSGWFATMGHQESPSIKDGSGRLSHLFKFAALYNGDDTHRFGYQDTYIPRSALESFIAIHKPYLLFHFPDSPSAFFGAAATGYTVNDRMDSIEFSLFFKPRVKKTRERGRTPLQFRTYEYVHGQVGGTITIDGKPFRVKRGDAYFDHMIPAANLPWPMKMNGWSWAEVTTPRYIAVIYAIRSLDDGFDAYTYKHLTLLNRKTGAVAAEFYDGQVEISEHHWQAETACGLARPRRVAYQAGKFKVSVFADNTAVLDRRLPGLLGFVNFMAFQKAEATIQCGGQTFTGSAFYEYLVSDMGAFRARGV